MKRMNEIRHCNDTSTSPSRDDAGVRPHIERTDVNSVAKRSEDKRMQNGIPEHMGYPGGDLRGAVAM